MKLCGERHFEGFPKNGILKKKMPVNTDRDGSARPRGEGGSEIPFVNSQE
jgi:hypothetical protein